MRRLIPVAAVLLALALVFRVGLLLVMAALLLLVYALVQAWMSRVTDRLAVRRRFTDHAFLGEEVEVELVVENGSLLPIPWLELVEPVPMARVLPAAHHEVVALGPRARHRTRYFVDCRRRGHHLVGPLTVRTGDPFGIVRLAPERLGADHLVVYPRIVPLQRLGLPARAPWALVPAPIALLEDPSRVVGVREYRWGDSPRRIHWKASARSHRLVVKQFQPGIARETLICLDLDRHAYQRGERVAASERAIVVAASVAHHTAVREGQSVGLLTEAFDPLAGERRRFLLPPRPEWRHLMSILEVLARAQIVPATHLADLIGREGSRLPWGSTVLAVSGRGDRRLLEELYALRRAGFAVSLVLVGSASAHWEPDLAVPVHRVATDMELVAWP